MTDTQPLPKLLIAEDDAYALQMLTMMLQDDFDIHTATDGKQAVEACLSNNFMAMLLDIGLPEMDGFEVIKCIRGQSGEVATLPIIVQTAHLDRDSHSHLLEVGANEVFTKPVKTDTLTLSVYKWHSRRSKTS